MASDRRRGFEAWARTHGDPAVRGHDRRAISEDLFTIAGHHDVCGEHIETLARRYRERFAGAQKILLTQQVGDEILRFQESPVAAVQPRTADARREDDEVLGLQVLAPPPPPIELRPPSARPPARPVSVPAPAVPETPAMPAAPASSGAAAERARSEAALDWSLPARPPTGGPASAPIAIAASAVAASALVAASPWTGPTAGGVEASSGSEQGMWGPLRAADPSDPAPPMAADGGLELLPSRAPGPRAVSSRPPPPSAGHAALEVESLPSRPPSARPGGGGARPGEPSSRPGEPPHESLVDMRARRASSAPPSAGPPALRDRLAELGPRGLGIAGGAVAAVFLLLLIVTRPSCLFPPAAAPVEGRFASEHLRIALTFPERWTHEAARDDDEARGDWTRASAVFFQGVQVDEFAIQLTLVTLSHDDRPATEDDLRTVASSELASGAESRSCASYTRFEGKAVRCTSIQTRLDRRFAMLEEYFLVGPRVVYARGLVETAVPVLAPPAASAEPPDTARDKVAERSPLPDLDARRLETILDSIQPL